MAKSVAISKYQRAMAAAYESGNHQHQHVAAQRLSAEKYQTAAPQAMAAANDQWRRGDNDNGEMKGYSGGGKRSIMK